MKKYIIIFLLLFFTMPILAQSTGPTFFYVVTSVDANGFESAFSNQVTATFNQGQKTASLNWIAPIVPAGGTAISGYNIYRSKTSGGPYTKLNTTLVSTVTFSDGFALPPVPSGLTVTVN